MSDGKQYKGSPWRYGFKQKTNFGRVEDDVKQVYKQLEGDVDIDVQCPATGNTALMFAAEKGDKPITELLLMEQASVFLINNRGLSALTLAHEKGHTAIVNMICTRLAEDKELDAHMLHASEEGDLATVLALLSFDTNLFFCGRQNAREIEPAPRR